MSTLPFDTRRNPAPRWSVVSPGATAALSPASSAGLPGCGIMVRVGPPLSASGPSFGSANVNGVPENNPPLATPGATTFGPVAVTVAVPSTWTLARAVMSAGEVGEVARMQLARVRLELGVGVTPPTLIDRL